MGTRIYHGVSTIQSRVQFTEVLRRQFGYNPQIVNDPRFGRLIVTLASFTPLTGFVFSLRGTHFDINAYDERLQVDPGNEITIYAAR